MEQVDGFQLTEMRNLSIVREERFEGEDCYVIRGYHPFKFPIEAWISKQGFLLQKISEPEEDGSYKVEIRRDIKLNIGMSRESFNFRPPPPRPQPRPHPIA
jgi:hypothetical protein